MAERLEIVDLGDAGESTPENVVLSGPLKIYEPEPEPEPPTQEEIVEAARAEAATNGYEDGLLLARRRGEQAAAALLRVEELRKQQNAELAVQMEAEAAALAVDIATALVYDHIAHTPESVASIVRSSLESVADAQEITVWLSPTDKQLIGEIKAPPGTRLHVRSDPGLQQGGCRVESDAGDVDGSVEGRVARLTQALSEARDAFEVERGDGFRPAQPDLKRTSREPERGDGFRPAQPDREPEQEQG